MVRYDHVVARGELVHERQPYAGSACSVQEQNWRTAAATRARDQGQSSQLSLIIEWYGGASPQLNRTLSLRTTHADGDRLNAHGPTQSLNLYAVAVESARPIPFASASNLLPRAADPIHPALHGAVRAPMTRALHPKQRAAAADWLLQRRRESQSRTFSGLHDLRCSLYSLISRRRKSSCSRERCAITEFGFVPPNPGIDCIIVQYDY
jgi:hypothetical protein